MSTTPGDRMKAKDGRAVLTSAQDDRRRRIDEGAEEREETFRGPWWRYPPILGAALSGALLALTFALERSGVVEQPVAIALYLLSMPFAGYWWFREGLEELIHCREIGIEFLMASATAGAAALGAWEEAAFLVFLYGGAEAIESFTFARTRSAIRSLLDLAPKEARVLRDGVEQVIPASDLQPGDVFVVRPGERIATDGVIRVGRSSVNEAAVTGESVPVDKAEGDNVFAGTLNGQGALQIEVTHAFADNTLSKIIHMVEEAQEQKGRAQRFIERFGRVYSPALLLSAVAVAVVPQLLGADASEWRTRAITLLVAGAPCALVMSTPVAMAAGIGTAGRRGVLIKGGMHLENLGTVKVIAFDKTGTLTHGKPTVTDLVPLAGLTDVEALRLAAAVERFSEHPLARAVVEAANARELQLPDSSEFEALTGAGARAMVEGREVYVGSVALFEQFGASLGNAQSRAAELQEQGKTVVLVGTRTEAFALLALRDEVRPNARKAIEAFHRAGVGRVVMLTGDHERTAKAIAAELGIDDVRAGLKPEDKVTAIRELKQRYGGVAMIGDGVNDAPALAEATVGIAMGTAGSDAAIEAADVALMADDLEQAAYALRLGGRARSISRQNIVFSLTLLALLIPGAGLGLLTVAVAVTAHEASELLAVANGLRVIRA